MKQGKLRDRAWERYFYVMGKSHPVRIQYIKNCGTDSGIKDGGPLYNEADPGRGDGGVEYHFTTAERLGDFRREKKG